MSRWIPIKYEEVEHPDGAKIKIISSPIPDVGEDVLITDSRSFVRMEGFCGDKNGYWFEFSDMDEVRAWMPLPEPYTEDEPERTERSHILRAVGRYIQTQHEEHGLSALGVNGTVYEVEDILKELDAIIREEEGEA